MTFRNVPLAYSKPQVIIMQRLNKRKLIFTTERIVQLSRTLPTIPPKLIVEQFILDFLFTYTKLVVEVDGVRWHEHTQGQRERTEHKTEVLTEAGFTVLRFTDVEIEKDPDGVAGKILAEEYRLWVKLYGKYNAPYGEVPVLVEAFSRTEDGKFEKVGGMRVMLR
jgi:hypothetical protein